MALPVKTVFFDLSYSLDGTPFCKIVTKSSINPNTLEYSLDGTVWWGHGGEAAPTGHIKSINGVAWEHVKSYCGIDQAHIKTAMGVEG